MATLLDSLMVSIGLDSKQLAIGLKNAEESIKKTAQSSSVAMDGLASRTSSTMLGLARSLAAPVAGLLSVGAVIKSYFGGVAQVAQMTGAYSPKLEEWRKKQALLQRVNREDIELYKKGREAITKFQISMASFSTTLMRALSPAIRWITEGLNKFSDWIDRNQTNIIRFLTVLGSIITAVLIPAFIRMAIAMLANPLTWIIAGIGLLALVIDDLVSYIRGGNSAFSDFWEWCTTIEGKAAGLTLAVAGIGVVIAKTLIPLITTGAKVIGIMTNAFRILTLTMMANPITAIITVVIASLMALWYWWDDICEAVKSGIQYLKDKFNEWYETIGIFHDYIDVVKATWDMIVALFTGDIKGLSEAWGRFCDSFKNLFQGVYNWFMGIWDSIINIVSSIGKTIKEKVMGVLPNWMVKLIGNDETEVAQEANSASTANKAKAMSNMDINKNITVNNYSDNPHVAEGLIQQAMSDDDLSPAYLNAVIPN